MAGQLGKIVDYIDQLQRLDAGKPAATSGTAAAPPAAAAHAGAAARGAPPVPQPRAAPEAEDVPRPCLPREVFLANAPAARDGFLLVPEVRRTPGSDVEAREG